MEKILDLHIHSKYSRACSHKINLFNLDETCRVKGVDILASGDFTYPEWFKHIKENLDPSVPSTSSGRGETGLYILKTANDDRVKFILSTELALIYKDGGRARRIHVMVHAPNIEAVEELNKHLDKHYNIRSDGRPILGMSAPDLVKLCLKIHPKFLIYPAHIWTPWFAVFGSKSGFDSMEECFHDQTEHIYAYETGLSSDPEMNWRVSELDNLTTLSNSDAHSLPNIGREANIMDLEKETYDEIYEIIKNKDLNRLKGTIEFYPEEGMYHYDGHRDCGISLKPSEAKKNKGICPVCKKPLTIGVLNRVEELADRPEGFIPKKHIPFIKLVELDKIIAESMNIKSRSSQKVMRQYNFLIEKIGSEFFILIKADKNLIEKYSNKIIADGVERVRKGELSIKPGFDGEYGQIKIFDDDEKGLFQKNLF